MKHSNRACGCSCRLSRIDMMVDHGSPFCAISLTSSQVLPV
jgi:hypothetical protein